MKLTVGTVTCLHLELSSGMITVLLQPLLAPVDLHSSALGVERAVIVRHSKITEIRDKMMTVYFCAYIHRSQQFFR